MHLINKFLDKFKNIRDPKLERVEVAEIISKVLDFEIKESEISIGKNEIKIKSNPTIKSQIYLRKEEIKERIKKELPKFLSFEIR